MAESPRSGSRLSRRGFLQDGIGRRAGLGASQSCLAPFLLPARLRHTTTNRSITMRGAKDFKPGAPFVEPEIRRSANGELNTTLRMQYAYKNIGGSPALREELMKAPFRVRPCA